MIYVYLKETITAKEPSIRLDQVAEIWCDHDYDFSFELTYMEESLSPLTAIDIVAALKQHYPDEQVQCMGASEVWIRREDTGGHKWTSVLLTLFVCLLLFLGAGLSIVAYHEDVNMQGIHSALHSTFTGEQSNHEYWLGIPYSIGLGLGILLFVNLFPRRNKNKKQGSLLDMEYAAYREQIADYQKSLVDRP
ncbi:MAG: stage V sporulation protein AA [Christensenellales bacterium]|jgi:stage V sporulation protein AA